MNLLLNVLIASITIPALQALNSTPEILPIFTLSDIINYVGDLKIEMLTCSETIVNDYQKSLEEPLWILEDYKRTLKVDYDEFLRCNGLLDFTEGNECRKNIRQKFVTDLNILFGLLVESGIPDALYVVTSFKVNVEYCLRKYI